MQQSKALQTFKEFHRGKHEKYKRRFPSLAFLRRHKISRRPRVHAYQLPAGVIGACG